MGHKTSTTKSKKELLLKRKAYNSIIEIKNSGIAGLRNAIIIQAANDLNNKYINFINTPCPETFYTFKTIKKYFDNGCEGLIELETAKYIVENVMKEIEVSLTNKQLDKIKSEFNY